jgi:hypothetical protein
MAPLIQAAERQNADLTYKYNREHGRHGWLRLTPAYSVKLVNRLLESAPPGINVLDPFSGTGTTPLCAAYRDDQGTGVEINPFLAWLASAKAASYATATLAETRNLIERIVAWLSEETITPCAAPAIHNIERWWGADELMFLRTLKSAIDQAPARPRECRDLLLVGFCRLLIKLSNAAFNHQSMSFKDQDELRGSLFLDRPDFPAMYRLEMESVLNSAADNPPGKAVIMVGDSRKLAGSLQGKFDMLITSPPYPNRMSYIRELRPYMYWLGYLTTGRDAGELDWSLIGGTWGIATSRLAEWSPPKDAFCPAYLRKTLLEISHADNKNGVLLATYVAKYFADMWLHIREAATMIRDGGEVHYVVGNSTFYDVLVPVERLYKDMLHNAGFKEARVTRLRKRNSKAELYEFDVSAMK